VLDPDDKMKHCDLLLALGEALSLAGESRRSLDTALPQAFSLAENIGDRTRASLACTLAITALVLHQAGVALATAEAAEWAERADQYAQPDTIDRARADTCLGVVKCVTEHQREGVRLLTQAVDLSRRLGDIPTFWQSGVNYLWHVQAPQHAEERLRLAEELAGQSRTNVTAATLGLASLFIGIVFLEYGQRQRAEEFFNDLKEMAERSGQVNLLLLSWVIDGFIVFLDGRLEDTIEIFQHTYNRGEELGLPEAAALLTGSILGLKPQLYLSHADDDMLKRTLEFTFDRSVKLVCLAHLGQNAEVNDALEQQVVARPGFGSADDEIPAPTDVAYLEMALLVKHHKAADLLLRRLADSSVRRTAKNGTCTARHLGAAAALLGRPDEAREHYQVALDVANQLRFRPEIALTHLQIAELLLEHYPEERTEALEHLDFAISEFREMKMQPSLERALRHKDILKA